MNTLSYAKYIEKLISTNLDELSLQELFALKLEYLYLCIDLSQFNFSMYTNLNYSYFNDLIRGKSAITLNKIENICHALNITPIELFDFNPLYTMKKEKCFIKFPIYEGII